MIMNRLMGHARGDVRRSRSGDGRDGADMLAVDQRHFEIVPRGRLEPFATSEYDVLPRGQFDYVRGNYYSPIPNVRSLSGDVWVRRSELGGVHLNLDSSLGFVERELSRFIGEIDPLLEDPHSPGVFFLHNRCFESVDAELLYALVRSLRPRRIIELGSGYSSLLINLAAGCNVAEGVATEHIAYDPYPRANVTGDGLVAPSTLVPISATDVPLDAFEILGPGDVLFVDTTHTVKVGSDVNYIVLDVLPRLHPGVVIHFHDIFLPREYPRIWFEENDYFWNEQYLIQAFLSFNTDFEVLVPAQALADAFPERLAALVPSFQPGVRPSSMWLRRRDARHIASG